SPASSAIRSPARFASSRDSLEQAISARPILGMRCWEMLRTKSGLPKHCVWNPDRHGKRRVRFRKAGFSTYIAGTPWSEDFMRQSAAALDGVKAQTAEIGAERTKPGSFDALCVSYFRSPDFRGL